MPEATERGGALGRLLVVNPNSNPLVSGLVRAAADRVLGSGFQAEVVHPTDSPLSIEGPADRAAAEPRALALLEANPGYDAYVFACFDDIALAAARRSCPAPVIGTVDASLALARTLSDRILIVTTVAAAVPGIEALLARYAAADRCTVVAAGIGVAAAAQPGAATDLRIVETLTAAAAASKAGVVVLGSAGLSGRAGVLGRRIGLPIIDCIEAALRLAVEAAQAFPARMERLNDR